MKKASLFIFVAMLFTGIAYTQNPSETFKPAGKPVMKVFSNFNKNKPVIPRKDDNTKR